MSFAVDYLYRSDADQKVKWTRLGEQFAKVHGRIWTRDRTTEVTRNHRWWVIGIKAIFAAIASITETIRFGANLAVQGSYFLQNQLYRENVIIDTISLIFFNLIAAPFVLLSWAAATVRSIPSFAGEVIDWMENNAYCEALPKDFQKT